MAYVNLNKTNYEIDGFDSIVIVKDLADIPCGVVLDVTGITDTSIKAGHVIIHNTSTGAYKPLALNGTAYASLGANEEYFGILKDSILVSSPAAAILRIGTVNAAAAEKSVGVAAGSIDSTIKAGLPHIDFIY